MVSIVFILIAICYFLTQSRFIFGGDSAEYATIAKTWGIAHPPGYPLYSFLINIVNHIIPFWTTPWKVALLSSIPTVITAFFIYKILYMLKTNKYLALETSLLYLFLFPVWQYALIPEVFGLHTMFVVIITYLLLRFLKNHTKTYLLLASFICGLCISHQQIFILFIPGWLYLLKDRLKKIYSDKKLILRMCIALCLGSSFYLYAVIVSLNHTVLDWTNAKTVLGLFQLITRSTYGSFKAYSGSGANIPNQIADMISGIVFILMDFKPLGIIFICIGVYVVNRYSKPFSRFLLISLVLHFSFLFYTNFFLTNSFSEGMFERFLIPLYFVLIFYLGMGVDHVYIKYFLPITNFIKNSFLKSVAKMSYFLFMIFFIFLIASQNFKTIKLITYTKTFDRFGQDLLATVPKDGILSTQGDNSTFPIYYHLYGLGERKDLVFFQQGLGGQKNYIDMIKQRSSSLVIPHALKNGNDFKKFVEQNKSKGFFTDQEMGFGAWRPYGLLWKYYPDNLAAASDSAALLAVNKRLWEHIYKIPQLSPEEKNLFHLNTVGDYYLSAYQNYSKLLLLMNKFDDAEKVIKNIVQVYKKGDPQSEAIYMNLLVQEKKCIQASRMAGQINLADTIKQYPGFVKSALSYLKTCEPNNKIIPEYQKKLIEYERQSKTDLNSF